MQPENLTRCFFKMKIGTKQKIVIVFSAVLLLVLGAWFGSYVTTFIKDREIEEILGINETLHKKIALTKTRTTSLSKSLKNLTDENTQLVDLVTELRDRPAKIQYVTRVETVVVPVETEKAFSEPPKEYLFELKPNLSVARFSYDKELQEPYRFETYSLSFRNSIVVSKKSATALLQISSSGNPGQFIDIPIDELSVDFVEEQKLFEPNIGVGMTVAASPSPDLLGSVFISFIHPTKNIDVAGLRIAANGSTAHFSFDAVGYNIGHHIPIFTDLWVHAGVGVDIYAHPHGHVSLGTKF